MTPSGNIDNGKRRDSTPITGGKQPLSVRFHSFLTKVEKQGSRNGKGGLEILFPLVIEIREIIHYLAIVDEGLTLLQIGVAHENVAITTDQLVCRQ